jgi:flagellar M-ring protein FliF
VNLAIPDSHIRKVWEHQTLLANPDQKSEDLEPPTEAQLAPVESKITAQLQAALEALPVGLRGGQAPTPYVTVTTYADTPVDPLPEPSMMAGVLAWLTDSWSTIALLAVLIVGLGMMSGWVKSVGENDKDKQFADGFGLQIPENIYDELDIQEEADGEEGAGGKDRKVSFEVTGAEVKEDVSALIKENPDAAVNLLKTWIGDAA